jgi:hypothetical protein
MTPDFRALCLELLQFGDQAGEIAANEGLWPNCDPGPDWVLDRTRAALAQTEPEPVVLTRPDCFDFAMDFLGGKEEAEVRNYIERLESTARAALAQPEPEEPTDDKLMDIARKTDLVYYMGKGYGFASPYTEETDITAEVLAFARKVRALDNGSASNPAEA